MINTQYFTVNEASEWASGYIGKNVTISNIAYLVQYGLIRKIGENGCTQVAFTQENGTVLDPFMGNGTTLKVAQKMHRNPIGIEIFSNMLS